MDDNTFSELVRIYDLKDIIWAMFEYYFYAVAFVLVREQDKATESIYEWKTQSQRKYYACSETWYVSAFYKIFDSSDWL